MGVAPMRAPTGRPYGQAMHRLLAVTLAAGLLAPAAALAEGDPPAPPTTSMTAFRVTAEGSGTYDRQDRQIAQGLGWEESVGGAFSYKVVLPMLWFDDQGHMINNGGPAAPGSALTGAATSHLIVHAAEGPKAGDCAAPLQDVPVAAMAFERAPGGQAADGENLIVTPLPSILLTADCSGMDAGLNLIPLAGGGTGALDQFLHVSKDLTVLQESFTLPVTQTDSQKAPVNCPGREGATISCTFRWSGKVSFQRVNQIVLDPDVEIGTEDPGHEDEPPMPQPTPVPPPAPGPGPGPGGAGFPVPKPKPAVRVTGTPRLDAKRARAIIRLACAQACKGTVSAYVKGDKAIATQRFTAKAGRTTPVTVRLDASAARRALRVARTVKLVVAVGTTKVTATAR
jgi:hypothetical protein